MADLADATKVRRDAAADVNDAARAKIAQQHLRDYLDYLVHERRLSANTKGSYKHDVETLLKLAGTVALDQLDVHHIRAAGE